MISLNQYICCLSLSTTNQMCVNLGNIHQRCWTKIYTGFTMPACMYMNLMYRSFRINTIKWLNNSWLSDWLKSIILKMIKDTTIQVNISFYVSHTTGPKMDCLFLNWCYWLSLFSLSNEIPYSLTVLGQHFFIICFTGSPTLFLWKKE